MPAAKRAATAWAVRSDEKKETGFTLMDGVPHFACAGVQRQGKARASALCSLRAGAIDGEEAGYQPLAVVICCVECFAVIP